MPSKRTWLVTGANRGIGLELVSQLSASPDNTVIAACRDPTTASALQTLHASLSTDTPTRLHIIQLETTDPASITAAAAHVTTILQAQDSLEHKGIDYLVNNAGVADEPEGAFTMSPTVLARTLAVNVGGPAAVSQAFLPLLAASTQRTVVNMSSSYGSMGLKRFGPLHAAYAVSKAALNMLTCKQAEDRPDITVVAITPGWIKTDMTKQEGFFEVSEGVTNVLKIVHALTPADTGKFFNYDGSIVPW